MTERNLPDAIRKIRVATRAQWMASGLSLTQFRMLVRSGIIVRVRMGVYATATALERAQRDPHLTHALRVAAVTCLAETAVASHHSAALIYGIDLLRQPPADVVTITCPTGRRHRRSNAIVHVANLPPEHVTTKAGVPITSVARTVIDLARTSSFMEGVVAADSTLHANLTNKHYLREVLAACSRWPGASQARRVVEFSDGRAESVLESCARAMFRAHGLEPPALQVDIRDKCGAFIARVDFYWPEHHTVVESDGLSKYATKQDLLAQFRRDRLLQRAGQKVVHFTWRELFDETDLLISNIRHTFSSPRPPVT